MDTENTIITEEELNDILNLYADTEEEEAPGIDDETEVTAIPGDTSNYTEQLDNIYTQLVNVDNTLHTFMVIVAVSIVVLYIKSIVRKVRNNG